MSFPPFLKKTIGANSSTDPDDVLIAKRSLERLGYYERPEWGLGDFTDEKLFDGIKQFQRDNGLEVDGVMKPGGETEQALVPQLAEMVLPEPEEENLEEQALNPSSKPSDDQCERMFEREMLVCDGVYTAVGTRAGAVCQQTAFKRYSDCLRGIPIHLLPPLSLPQYLRDKFDF